MADQFNHPYPERMAQEPLMPGQRPLPNTPLKQLRRQQLHDLARAYGISVKRDGTKEEIMPAMIDAEQRGVFRNQRPISEYYFLKAQRDPDKFPPAPLVDPEMMEAPAPSEDAPRLASKAAQKGGLAASITKLEACDVAELRRRCKHAKINSFGKGRAWMIEQLKTKMANDAYAAKAEG